MALTDKNIVITPNVGQSADPKIVFSGADASSTAQNITLQVYPTSNGTLSFEGSAGQLFSITNSLSGTIFSVNDVSGIPSIEVLDTGAVKIAQYGGDVTINNGKAYHAGNLITTGTTPPTGPTVGQMWYDTASDIVFQYFYDGDSYQWVEVSPNAAPAGYTISNDISTNATYYPAFVTTTTGLTTEVRVSSTKLQFNPSTGTLTTTDVNVLSDLHLKDNIVNITDPMSVLSRLQGKSFTWKDNNNLSYGVIAQELETVLPELVKVDAQGNKSVNYIPLIAFLIEAVKKQQQEIDQIKQGIK